MAIKTYKATVTEVHTYTRTYWVNAANKTEARKEILKGNQEDADNSGSWDWAGIKSIKNIEESETDLTVFN